jgi:phosphoribosylaminoimidazole carboxylase/phosphoribosylaminoimidazole-succinocarboxamide synthase
MTEKKVLARITKLAEGKTKIVWGTDDPYVNDIESMSDITAGDGAKHDILAGKAEWSNTTTCNVFRLLKSCGIPLAFIEQTSETSFSSKICTMIPLEVVTRREAHGSYLKRNPHLRKGQLFPKLVFELFLKTSGRVWKGQSIPCDDPLIVFSDKYAVFFEPDKPLWTQQPFMEIPLHQFYDEIISKGDLAKVEEYNRKVFLILEKAWQLQNFKLVDFKLEYALASDGEVILADVVDSDSWRKLDLSGQYSDKQIYREGGPLDAVAEKFRETAELSNRFNVPHQQIIIWNGSPSDETKVLGDILEKLELFVQVTDVICSGHKKPIQAYNELHQYIQDVSDTVIITAVGMSNGLAPMLSANCMVPVIAVPTTSGEFPNDIWSSLRTPSNVPLTTVLNQKNAALAALQILAMRNPAIYAYLRYELETRLSNLALIGS